MVMRPSQRQKPSLLAQAWNQEVTTYAGQQGVPSEVTALYPQPHLPELCELASCRKSIGKHHQAKATAGADAGPSSVSSNNKKREKVKKDFVITIPPRLLAHHHQVGCGCYRTPHSTPPRAVSRPAVSPVPGPLQSGWRGPRAPTQGQTRLLCTSELGRR